MIFHTENSIYEVDQENKCIRRLYGKDNPTPRLGEDSKWKAYTSIMPVPIRVGVSVFIFLDVRDTPLLEPGNKSTVPAFVTSPVTRIVDKQNLS